MRATVSHLKGRLSRPSRALGLLGWALLGSPLRRKVEDLPGGATVTRSWGAWWGRHQGMLRVLAALALCWSTAYLAWRIGWSWHGSNQALWIALLLAELYGLWNLAALALAHLGCHALHETAGDTGKKC